MPTSTKLPPRYDVVVIGAGPNGLSAAIELARSQLSVLVLEAHAAPGGGARTEGLTLPGYLHDVCSTVYPLGVASPFFRTLALGRYGLSWAESPAPLAHVLDDGTVVTLERSIEDTAAQLGSDRREYMELLEPLVERFEILLEMVLGPLRFPKSPLFLARFGLSALASMKSLAARRFREPATSALFAGMAAHAMLPLDATATAAFALILAGSGHHVGWPIAVGGSRSITQALVACLREFGGELRCDAPVRTFSELPSARAYVFDLTPRQLLEIGANELPAGYRSRLQRFRYGPGVYKMDWALREPIPWKNAVCRRACTVHLSGTLEQIHASEAAVHAGSVTERPFTLVAQPSLFDASRAPEGGHVAWAYCHVPHGSTLDVSEHIESHIERFAPGFRDVVLSRATRNALEMQAYNANYIGGDINGGQADLSQLFFRPTAKLDPYATANPRIFICSSSTPPGGGVHGMCGYWAAQSVKRRILG